MKFLSFWRLFGKRSKQPSMKRGHRPAFHRSPLYVEHLETRELLAAAPFVLGVAPPPGTISLDPRPPLSITFSESMRPSEVRDAANYLLFDANGTQLAIDSATYDNVNNQVFLLYNGGNPLPAGTFSLFLRGDRIHDVDDGLPLAGPGQLIAVNGGQSSISQIGMPGDGKLEAITNYTPFFQDAFFGTAPVDVTLADVDADGITDMITANTTFSVPGSVDIFKGLAGPDGGFSNTATSLLLAPTTVPTALVVTDLNGDGFRDIAVTSNIFATTTGTVTVFLNNGQGAFPGSTAFLLATNPVDIVAGDFNRDLLPDLAVASNTTQDNLAVFLNTSTGSFAPATTFTAGPNPLSALATGDFDSDLGLDIVVASTNGLQVMLNTSPQIGGPVNFVPGAALLQNSPTLSNFTSVAVADVDSIGTFDIVATTSGGAGLAGQAVVFLNNGSASFAQGQPFLANPAFGSFGGATRGIALADANGDGREDIFVVNDNVFAATADTMAVLLSIDTSGNFGPPVGYRVDDAPLGVAVALGANGRVETVATVSTASQDTTTLRGRGDGTFHTSRDIAVANLNLPSSSSAGFFNNLPFSRLIASADLNGDFAPDVAIANPTTNQITVLLATPGGPNPYGIPTIYGVGNRPSGIAIGDLTGTGKMDIVVANQLDSTVTVLANDGNGGFIANTIVQVGRSPVDVVLADFNGDNNLDLAVAHNGFSSPPDPSDRGVSVAVGRGDRSFFLKSEVAVNVQAVALAVADFDQDGKQDIAVVEDIAAGNVVLLLGDTRVNIPTTQVLSFSRRTTFSAGEFPSSIAVGDLNRDGLPDVVVTNQSVTNTFFTTASYMSVLLNTPGGRFLPAIRTDIASNTDTRFQSIVVTDINQDFFPDIVASSDTPIFTFTNQLVNNLVAYLGAGDGTFGDAHFYSTAGGGNGFFTQPSPTYLDVVSNPLVLVTTFSTRGSVVSSNLIKNGTFEVLDLNAERGNIVGWKQARQRDSHGMWALQTALISPQSSVAVPNSPQGQYAAMLDQPDVGLGYLSGAGNLVPGVTTPIFGTFAAQQVSDYDGATFLYQDFFIPDTASQVTLSFSLYINNGGTATTPGGFVDGGALDFFPDIPAGVRPRNQQVRVDIMNPNAPIEDIGAGVFLNIFRTTPQTPGVFGYDADRSTQRPDKIVADLTAFRGRTVRLRVAMVTNLGKVIVGLDNVQVNASFNDTQSPSVNGLRLRNPGFDRASDPVGFAGNTTDPTIVGQVSDDGGPDNIDFVAIDLNNDGNFSSPGDYIVANFDAEGNFQTTLPTDLPGPYTIGIRVFDKAGNSFDQSISFNFQGPSFDGWQAMGPGPLRFIASNVAYSTVSGKITSTALDPRDTSGNTFYVGSDNGGVWKTTDGGHNWSPLTDFLPGQAGLEVSVNIGALAVDPNNPDNVYAGTGVADTYATSNPGFGILKSANAGASWTLIGSVEFDRAKISRIEISKRRLSDNVVSIYVGVASGGIFGPGIYRSEDGGTSWQNILNPNTMFLENGAALPGGTQLASITDFRIDRLSFEEENLWVGIGNIGLVGVSATGGVWKSPNHGATWFRQGGMLTGGVNRGLPDAATYGANIRRVILAVYEGRASEQGTVYVLMNNPPIDANSQPHDVFNIAGNQGRFASGLYKTDDGGLVWTKVMLRQNIQRANQPVHDYAEILLFGGVGTQEEDAVGALAIDPNDPSVVYVGGSTRYHPLTGPFTVNGALLDLPHGLIRVDTRNMVLSNELLSPTICDSIPDINVNWDPLNGAGDDRYKKIDALTVNNCGNTGNQQPGTYPTVTGLTGSGGAYEGEGVFWVDLQMASSNRTDFSQLRLPATVHALTIDGAGRLLVGTEGGLWRGVSQGFVYDTTSGGPFGFATVPGTVTAVWSIESDLGVATPRQPGMIFTDLNGNLQISSQTSIAIDPVDRQVLHSSFANLGWAKTGGPLPDSLGWTSTLDLVGFLDPFVDLAPFAGRVFAAPRDPNPPAAGPAFSTLYRTFSNISFDLGRVAAAGQQIQRSIVNGDQGTFLPQIRGLDLSGPISDFPGLAVHSDKIVDEKGFFLDQLLFGTNRVFRSDNSGVSWDTISPPLTNAPVTALAIAPSGNHAFYVGTQNGQIFVDLRNGSTPFPNRSAGLSGQRINGITIDPNSEVVAYAAVDGFGTGGHVFITLDGGVSWNDITGNLLPRPAYALAVDRRPSGGAPNGKLYVGTETGVFVSTNFLSPGASTTWTRLGVGLPNVPVRDVQFDAVFDKLIVATQGRGTFSISTDAIGPQIVLFDPPTPTLQGLTSVTVVFDEPIDPRTFTFDKIRILTGPNGPIQALSIDDIPDPLTSQIDHRRFRVTFPTQLTDGIYTITLSPTILDFRGNPLDNNDNLINGEDPLDNFTSNFIINSTDDGRFIAGLYRDVLDPERAPDTAGFQTWVGPVDEARTTGLNTVVTQVVTSDEVRANFVSGLYSSATVSGSRSAWLPLGNLLKRAPSASEVQFFVDAIKLGATPEQVIDVMTASREYFLLDRDPNVNVYVGDTDVIYVNQMYLDALGRNFDAAGRNFHLAVLNNAEFRSRTQVAEIVANSIEYRNNLVTGHYFAFLGRAPGTLELLFWVGQMQQGGTDEQIIAQIIGSDEYYRNHGNNNNSWLAGAFQDILFRAPSPAETQTFLTQLAAGASRTTVGFQLLNSDEYRTRLVTGYFGRFLKRVVTAEDVTYFTAQMRAGVRDEAILAQIVGSNEYFQSRFGSATTLTAQDDSWVRNVFIDVMGRLATDAEAGSFVASFLQPAEQAARTAVSQAFTTSFEYRSRLVAIAYQNYLGRTPSTGEISLWQPVLRQAPAGAGSVMADEQFLSAVLASGEYFARQREQDPINFGSTIATNRAWSQSLFTNLLDRPAQSGELGAILNAVLDSYTQTRQLTAFAFLTSTEYRRATVADYFSTYLRREAKSFEIDFFVSALAAGARQEDVIATILASEEYFQNPTIGLGNNTIWLNQVYLDLLGRDRDAFSQTFLDQLNAALPGQEPFARLQIVQTILAGGEYQARFIGGPGVGVYTRYLGRTPSASETAFWVSQLQAGFSDEVVISQIIASSEYFLQPHQYP